MKKLRKRMTSDKGTLNAYLCSCPGCICGDCKIPKEYCVCAPFTGNNASVYYDRAYPTRTAAIHNSTAAHMEIPSAH